MKVWLTSLALLTGLTACSEQPQKPVVDPAKYQVQTAQELQQRFDALNVQLAQDFQEFKKVESIAFAHQFPLDVNNLQSLNQHLVSSTALKPSKIAYCDMMNSYFADMYRLGHYNLELVDDIKLPNAKNENLKANFSDADRFYTFILDRYTTYRQVQQTMGYGCNLKAAL
ncbi:MULTISPECIES: hypothetical protein [Acinetobacter]|uniref:hypothetical protein n=1 Tax=Acinetobacter TaxID=469 RepID=UPI0002D014F5|nr:MULTISPECIES: hypothetical protein [Acinetobacter]ENU63557.1 hypothetical protein F980_00880 [Acinetobacter lwoffii NIPH 715]ENX30132.1 hypothetical protein F890_02024 [Acinetobacter sp. CIP 64.7]MCU4440419.1 hypothetical protein [Acinetobacter lwoffii]QXB85177.1 hypothetical protein I6L24_10300 [Acinetobacter lwoffii]